MLDTDLLSAQACKFGSTFYGKEFPKKADRWLDEEHIRTTLDAVWPLPQRNTATLLHGDFWPSNVLWRDGKLVAVLDWEEARSGDPLSDLAISRLEIAWIFGIDAMHLFTCHYQSLMNIDFTDLPYWDLYTALRMIRIAGYAVAEWAAFLHPFGRQDITEQKIKERYQAFLNQAFEKLVPSQ